MGSVFPEVPEGRRAELLWDSMIYSLPRCQRQTVISFSANTWATARSCRNLHISYSTAASRYAYPDMHEIAGLVGWLACHMEWRLVGESISLVCVRNPDNSCLAYRLFVSN
ncbi:hypothetical protein M404DRAFT_509205 [Pisolithus tinctorius Marx 270]|uniref:Uncharacterized protein n=1 Tax=Pisolithus tinctorius Marx 270 TaxID=870435 RepID=A0A0C3JDU9_PISTI|nr:hypothetical protein M404DRAFT_296926 [Pisolithus tinctorius Marx 270]KIO05945.1 hypothetical protein M404DRAFT_509205 [Pisolithus tinctorius Marx 270]